MSPFVLATSRFGGLPSEVELEHLTTSEGLLHDPEACIVVLGCLLHPIDIREWKDLDDHDVALLQGHHLISSCLRHRGARMNLTT
ncbi:uncharacterized protein Pyn_09581 [Prunus yedoensis var. nudiflora]|uniref:Uncharacterized protein n=1 Tax=Prunus yedoensis var. nudiflora TaxID=2094558 RepID=A0A314Z663_PRUYE|nr:uncharacterized protein Pyn_09581 [Prunus yedoensis var. nudiflora]